jgi:hypothetical protein
MNIGRVGTCPFSNHDYSIVRYRMGSEKMSFLTVHHGTCTVSGISSETRLNIIVTEKTSAHFKTLKKD